VQQKSTSIYIIGAGAIGKALAVFLQHGGKAVTLIRGHINEGPEYMENIEVTLSNGEKIQSDIPVSNLSHHTTLEGILVVTSKSYGNQLIAERLDKRSGNSPVVVLQNGLNVETAFTDLHFPGIYRCVLFASSQYIGENKLRFKPASVSPIGVIKGSIGELTTIINSLDNPHLVFKAEKDIQSVIWTKTIINSVFNSVCPLLEADNGIFYRNEKALNIAREIIEECIGVATAAGISLDTDTVLERLLLISKTSGGQLISTYQDILHMRKTEIATFNGTIALIADELGQKELARNTRLLGELIEIKSGISMEK
jgi:2-dehydropantoate 2-reductase